MITLLIDPSVGPYDSSAQLEAWLDRLAELRKEHGGDAEAEAAIDHATEQAREWLKDQQDVRWAG